MSKLHSLLSPLSRKLSKASPKSDTVFNRAIHHEKYRVSAARKLQYENPPTRGSLVPPVVQIKITQCDSVEAAETTNDVVVNCESTKRICKNGVNENKFLNILGRGGFGTVFKGLHKGNTVAVKVSREGLMPPGEENALNLDHPNILKTLHISKTGEEKENFRVIVMEYFPNSQSLVTLIENSEFDMAPNLLKFSKDIAEGLWYCHRNGVLHLDVKPQNILVCDGICKICDFGSSRRQDYQNNFTFQGTPVYAAPELLLGSKPTEKCDVYSLGITFWQMKSRRRPYSEFQDVETVIYKVLSQVSCYPYGKLL
ncbi:unnamed protein product, partial [Callosobruchus maculatus]